MHATKYSLLLPVRNEAGRIEETVRTVFRGLPADSRWEVCIGDDFSDDGTTEKLKALSAAFPFRLIRPDENLGRSGIRNLLAEAARGEYLVFMDGDCKPMAGFFKAWEGVEPGCAYVGKVSYDEFPASGFTRFLHRGSGLGKLGDRSSFPPAYFISQNFCVSRIHFAQAGRFRTDLLGWGGEDVDFGWKLAKLGVNLRYRGEAEVRHPAVTKADSYFARLVHFGRVNLPVLVSEHPELVSQYKLAFARPPHSLLFLNPWIFKACKLLITGKPHWPWPFAMYRYVTFNCYARGFRQAMGVPGRFSAPR